VDRTLRLFFLFPLSPKIWAQDRYCLLEFFGSLGSLWNFFRHVVNRPVGARQFPLLPLLDFPVLPFLSPNPPPPHQEPNQELSTATAPLRPSQRMNLFCSRDLFFFFRFQPVFFFPQLWHFRVFIPLGPPFVSSLNPSLPLFIPCPQVYGPPSIFFLISTFS